MLMDLEYSKGMFEEHIYCRDEKKSQTSQMLGPDGSVHFTTAAAQDRSTQSTADPQASCEAPICLRDVVPWAAEPCSSVLSASGYQATLQLQTHVLFPATGCVYQSQLLLLGGREYDFGEGWL